MHGSDINSVCTYCGTGCDITAQVENNKIIKTYPSKGMARVSTIRTRKRFTIEDIPVWTKEFGEVNDLPIYSFGIFYIVSQIVKSALPLRDDLLVPDDLIRDNVGNIIGCKSFSI